MTPKEIDGLPDHTPAQHVKRIDFVIASGDAGKSYSYPMRFRSSARRALAQPALTLVVEAAEPRETLDRPFLAVRVGVAVSAAGRRLVTLPGRALLELTLLEQRRERRRRKAKDPIQIVAPIASKKQLMRGAGICAFLGDISEDSLTKIRNDAAERFPRPLQMLGNTPMWSVEQIERYVGRKEQEVSQLQA